MENDRLILDIDRVRLAVQQRKVRSRRLNAAIQPVIIEAVRRNGAAVLDTMEDQPVNMHVVPVSCQARADRSRSRGTSWRGGWRRSRYQAS
jgi:hypothetical protein